ncbi:MAG: HlyD family type I secretion periplasmic adaptor subunit [Hydrogenophaga sp.]
MMTNLQGVTDVASRSEDDNPVKTDAGAPVRVGWWILILGLGTFLFWGFLAPLDQGVPMTGTVTVAGNKKAVQHQTGGTIQKILVKEGDAVKSGQPLVEMDGTQSRSNAETTRIQYFTARSAEARLIAERDSLKTIAFPPETLGANVDARIAGTIDIQRQLFSARLGAQRSELAAIDENVAGLLAQNAGLDASRTGKQLQLTLLKEQVAGMRNLAKDGYAPRNRLLELERTLAQLEAAVLEDTGNLTRGQRQISELKLRRLQRQQDFQKEVRSQLADVQKETEALRSRLEGLDHDVNNNLVRAPVDGVVADMAVHTDGGVVGPGFRMMDIVPLDEPLIVEGQIPIHLVDSVHPDLPVDLIFSAFNQNTTPRIPAKVTQVSPDRLIDEATGMPYFRMRAEITPEGQKQMATLSVRAGMPVELFVRTGERSLMNYLMRPLSDHLKSSMSEE